MEEVKIMSKFFVFVLAVGMAFVLTACSHYIIPIPIPI